MRRHHYFLCLRGEKQSLPVQDIALWPFHFSQDLYKGHKTYPTPMLKDGYNSFLYLDNALVLVNSYTPVNEDGQRVVQLQQRLDFVLSLEMYQLKPTHKFTHLGLVFNKTEYDHVTAPR